MLPYDAITELHFRALTLSTWGIMVAIGFAVGIWVFIRYGEKALKLKEDDLLNVALLAFAGGIIGSRLMYVIEYWKQYIADPWEMLRVWHGGMVYYGGFILAFILVWTYIRVRKLSFWQIADGTAVGLSLGLAIGRIGCHLIRDHPGEPTDVPWAINYDGVLRHETAMYLVLANLVGFLIIWFWLKRKKLFSGAIFSFFLVWYGITRFVVEFFRASDLPYSDIRWWGSGEFKGLTISQVISVILALVGFFIWVYNKKARNR